MAVLSQPAHSGSARAESIRLELEDVPLDIRRAVLTAQDAPPERMAESAAAKGVERIAPAPPAERQHFQVSEAGLLPLEKLQAEYVRWVLDRTGGNKTKAAKLLGIQRATLYSWTDWYEKKEKKEQM